jgi:hypothetical protein
MRRRFELPWGLCARPAYLSYLSSLPPSLKPRFVLFHFSEVSFFWDIVITPLVATL